MVPDLSPEDCDRALADVLANVAMAGLEHLVAQWEAGQITGEELRGAAQAMLERLKVAPVEAHGPIAAEATSRVHARVRQVLAELEIMGDVPAPEAEA